MGKLICLVDGCTTEPNDARRGMCSKHYWAWWRRNRTSLPAHPSTLTPAERFWRRVQGETVQTCWTWGGSPDRDGYGKFVVHGKWFLAHRYAYEQLIADIPDGLELDHLCRNRACVNPWHLDPVTREVNAARAQQIQEAQQGGVCSQGHPRNAKNTYVAPNGRRTCRACNRAIKRRVRERETKGAAA